MTVKDMPVSEIRPDLYSARQLPHMSTICLSEFAIFENLEILLVARYIPAYCLLMLSRLSRKLLIMIEQKIAPPFYSRSFVPFHLRSASPIITLPLGEFNQQYHCYGPHTQKEILLLGLVG